MLVKFPLDKNVLEHEYVLIVMASHYDSLECIRVNTKPVLLTNLLFRHFLIQGFRFSVLEWLKNGLVSHGKMLMLKCRQYFFSIRKQVVQYL